MFSQLRNAVEQLAQPIREAASHENHSDPPARSGSLDIQAGRSTSPLSSSELAESALSSLRKSLVSQRPNASPSPKATTPPLPENARPRKSNLEERLRRATFAIGDVSGSTTPGTPSRSSRVGSPSPMGADRNSVPPIVQEPGPVSIPPASSPTTPPAPKEEITQEQPSTHALSEMSATKEIKSEEEEVTLQQPQTQPSPDIVTEEVKSQEDVKQESFPIHTCPDTDVSEELKLEWSQEPSESSDSAPSSSQVSPLAEEHTHEESPVKAAEPDMKTQEPNEESATSSNVEIGESVLDQVDSILPPPSPSPAKADNSPTSASDDELPSSTIDDSVPEHDDAQIPPIKQDFAEDNMQDDQTTNELDLRTSVTPAAEARHEEEVVHKPDLLISQNGTDNDEPLPQVSSRNLSEESPVKQVELPKTTPPVEKPDNTAELESLQARLKQVEQRFSDVSTSFKRLQAEKLAADVVLREATPLESVKDAEGLREFFAQVKSKEQVFQDEIKRLNQKLEVQEDRIEELRDTHRLESQYRSAEVNKLKIQLEETEALFQAAQRATSNIEEAAEKHKAGIAQLQTEVEKAKTVAKEEEEKRVKAISLLKTVRQKLVKAEKDKEDALREVASVREREQGDKNREQADKQDFQREIKVLTATHEQATVNLRLQFNKDFNSMQDRYKQEISSLRGQLELDLASAKSNYTKELGLKISQIATLENSLNKVTRDKNEFFDQLQLRQAELESAQAHLESVQHQNTEFQFQLREANDRVALLKEECSELLREQETRSRDPGPSAEEVARMVSSTEAKYESKLSELKRNLAIMEKERHESESDWSRKLKEKVKELDDLKRILGSAAKTREADENVVANLKAELAQAQQAGKNFERQLSELPLLRDHVNELDTEQKMLKEQEKESNVKTIVLEKQLEGLRAREAQLKQSNKVLREEMRKVQSSAALLERQRNPGVGYWTTRDGNGSPAEPRTSNVSVPETPARVASPTPSTATSNKNEEEVNLEYLRNVILQFLEHKEMRPNLVKVLSIILHFTPQETRRLIAKV